MSKNRSKTNLVTKKGKNFFELSKEKATGKFFIKGTDIEVSLNRICRKGQEPTKISKYNFDKPSFAQQLDDVWDHYAWSADDF